MTSTKLIALMTVVTLAATPTLSFARASGGGGGGRGSGGISNGSSGPGSVGSRGSRTYDNNANKPIERSTVPQSSPGAAPSTARPAPAVPAQPVGGQPPFWQRHPILTGLAAGVAGSWIGHMLFGANNSLAAEGEATGSNAGSFFNLFLLLLIGVGGVYMFMRLRRSSNTAPAYAGLSSASVGSTTIPGTSLSGGGVMIQAEPGTSVSSGDISTFSQILRDVQTVWSRQDLEMLKRLATPEMVHYFSSTLAENVSREVENHVEDVNVLGAQVQEAWQEDQTDYATVLLRWTARDYDVALNKTRGESGYVVEGDDRTSTEVSEAWTFMRYRQGKWLLSAIQQVA